MLWISECLQCDRWLVFYIDMLIKLKQSLPKGAMCHVMKPYKFLKVHMIFGPKKIMHHVSGTATKHAIMSPGCLHAGKARNICVKLWQISHGCRCQGRSKACLQMNSDGVLANHLSVEASYC